MKDYTAFIFDFDLTLVDSSEAILTCFRHTLSEFGCTVPDEKKIYNTIGLTLVDALKILSGNDSDADAEAMRTVYVKKADEIMAKQSFFYPKALEILHRLRTEGKKIAVVSSKMKYRIEETFLAHTDSIPVDCIIGYGDAANPKPAPDGILKAAEMLGAASDDILYIGDSYIDAAAAQSAGVDFAAVTTGSTDSGEFRKYPYILIAPSLAKLFDDISA